ncbi:MAG: TIR domain-containing protein [Saprospirales bacterium]|nr:TIR domain-containing protein [Saprospirales bacterium]
MHVSDLFSPDQIMQYDIFISYAHHDNTARGNWIEQFHQKLAADYFGRLGKKLNIFSTGKTSGRAMPLPNRLQQALRATRLFVPVLSPAYLSSEWCRLEFLHFLEQAGELILDGRHASCRCSLMPGSFCKRTAQQRNRKPAALPRICGITASCTPIL